MDGYPFFGGPIALQCFVHIADKKSCNIQVVFNQFDRVSILVYINIYQSIDI